MRYLLPLVLALFAATVPGIAQNGDVEPTPAPAATTLKARVYYENSGRPVRRTSVMLMGHQGGGPREFSGLTDANGLLTIKNVRAGRYFAIVNAPGAVSPLAYVDVRTARNDEALNELFAIHPSIMVDGVTDLEVEIPVKMGGAIGGRVTYADGSPAIGLKVEVLRKVGDTLMPVISNFSAVANAMLGGAGTFMTDDRGMYRFPGLPPGDYVVKATEAARHATQSSGPDYGIDAMLFGNTSMINVFFQNALDEKAADTIRVEMGQEVVELNLIIPDRALHSLEGKLVAAKDKLPIRNARLTISRVGDDPVEVPEYGPMRGQLTSTTDNEGKWKFVELPKGKYRVSVNVPNSEFFPEEKAYGGSAFEDAYTSANRAVANAMRAAENAVRMASNGGYYDDPRPQKPPAPKFSPKTAEFEIDTEDLKERVVEVDHGARISGTVEIEKGSDLPETLSITAWEPNSDLSSSTSVYTYDYREGERSSASAKEFTLEGAPIGSVMLRTSISDDGYYVKSMTSGAIDLLSAPLDLRSASVVSNVKIVLSKEVGRLDLTVMGADRLPVSGYQITLVPVDASKMRNSTFYRTKATDGNGLAKFTAAPMEYAVISIPRSATVKPTKDFYEWLAEAVKSAPKFKIEAGSTSKGSIVGSARLK
jgi:hypothetical protein